MRRCSVAIAGSTSIRRVSVRPWPRLVVSWVLREKTGSLKASSMSLRSSFWLSLTGSRKSPPFPGIFAAPPRAEQGVAGDDLPRKVDPLQQPERIGKLEAPATRCLMPERGLKVGAESRDHMDRRARRILAGAHRLAVDSDVAPLFAFVDLQRTQHRCKGLRIDRPQGLGQRGMAGGRRRETQCGPLSAVQTAPQFERRLHPLSSAYKRHHDQRQY